MGAFKNAFAASIKNSKDSDIKFLMLSTNSLKPFAHRSNTIFILAMVLLVVSLASRTFLKATTSPIIATMAAAIQTNGFNAKAAFIIIVAIVAFPLAAANAVVAFAFTTIPTPAVL